MCIPAFAQETFTLFDGTTGGTGTSTSVVTNDKVPAYIEQWNTQSKSQIIIPAEYLTQMKNGTITSLKFYTTSYNTPYTSASTADVFLKELDYTAFTGDHLGFESKIGSTIVYQGTVTIERVGPTNNEWGEMTITFTTPYKYRGGNLLIAFENTTNAGWKRFLFNGQNVMWHAGAAGYQMTATYFPLYQQDFIPKTTFTYTPGEDEPAYEEFFLVGSFNDWSQTEDGGRLVFETTDTEGVYQTEGTLEDNAEFKIITPFGDDWIWLGGVDENEVGYFLINSDLLNQPITLVDGANFRMEQGGKFSFSLNANDMTLTVVPVVNPGIIGDVNCDGEVTTVDITCLYNYLLNGDETYIATSDVNGDGEITTVDITVIYNILMGNQ